MKQTHSQEATPMPVNATSEWFYVWLAYGLTGVTLLVYFFRMRARRVAALRSLTDSAALDVTGSGTAP